jgi:hypothetical protein
LRTDGPEFSPACWTRDSWRMGEPLGFRGGTASSLGLSSRTSQLEHTALCSLVDRSLTARSPTGILWLHIHPRGVTVAPSCHDCPGATESDHYTPPTRNCMGLRLLMIEHCQSLPWASKDQPMVSDSARTRTRGTFGLRLASHLSLFHLYGMPSDTEPGLNGTLSLNARASMISSG